MKPLDKLLSDLSEYARQNDFVFKRLYRLLYREDFFDKALNNLQYIKKEERDSLKPETISHIIEGLRDQSYRPKKLVNSPEKKNKEETGSVLPEIEDLVVQEMIRIVLDLIYEPLYSRHNHGYRINKSVHTILEDIRKNAVDTVWFLKGEVPEAVLSIDPNILIGILRKRIGDERFLNLIRKFINSGYLKNWRFDKTYSKTPVATGLAQTLLNIYLNELDRYIEDEIKKTFVQNQDKEVKNLKFFRYANSWLIAVIGSKRDCEWINQKVRDFLKDQLKLELSDECFEVIHNSKDVNFLEYRIFIRKTREKSGEETKRIILSVPIGKITEIAREKKLIKDLSAKNWMPVYRPFLVNATDIDILKYYNRELYGIYRYYGIAENVSHMMNSLAYLMEYSCLKTFANKHKTTVGKFKSSHMTRQKRWGITVRTGENEETVEFYKGFTRKRPYTNQKIDRLPGRSILSQNKNPRKTRKKKKRKG